MLLQCKWATTLLNYTEWKSPLTFNMHTSIMCSRSTETTDTEICGFIVKYPTTDHMDSQYTYFSRETYTPPMPNELQNYMNPPSLEKFSRDLYQASHTASFTLIMDGDSSKKHNQNHEQYLLGSHPPFGT